MQIQLNNQFKLRGMKNYVIEEVLHQMGKSTPAVVTKKDSDYSLRHKKLINIISDMTESTQGDSGVELHDGERSGSNSSGVTIPKSFNEIMLDRWSKSNALNLPLIDQKDCREHGQVKLTPVDQMH